jgi:L-ascorbate metabolism protein UlaG (beta-lactamase superfamily)
MKWTSTIERTASLALCAVLACSGSRAETQVEAKPIRLTWIGHAGFEVVSPGGTRLLIDPWIMGNRGVAPSYADTTRYSAPATRPAAILVTHPHGDHDGDVPPLARMSGAQVIATGDHIERMKIPEGQYLSINIGGMQRVGDVEIRAVPAMHSTEPGRALGYVLKFSDGRTLYHTGDTWAFSDMALIEQFFHPTILLIAAGGGRAGQDPATAAEVARTYFKAQTVVPMHYGSLPPPFATREEVAAAFESDPRARLATPGTEMLLGSREVRP